jgi:two-component system cell cycle sensor histidine kinase/response regulator CckA
VRYSPAMTTRGNDAPPWGSVPDDLRARIRELEEREQAQALELAAARATADELRNVIESVPWRLYWRDREQRLVGCNRRFAQDFGAASANELLEVAARAGKLPEPICTTDPALAAGKHRFRGGKQPLHAPNGETIGQVAFYGDVFEHDPELRALRASEQRYRTLVEQAQDGFFIADRKGLCIGSNHALRSMLQYSESELAQLHIRDLVDPDDLARTPLRAREVRNGRSLASQRVLMRKDGSRVVTEISSCMLSDGTFEAVVRDVSERLLAERERQKLAEELRHSQKMESIGRLAGGIAHDFNNLLLVILANAHVLRRRYEALLGSELDGIVAAAERGGTLTRQLLSFSRKRVLKPSVIDLNEIVGGMQTMLERLMNERVRLEFRLAPQACRVLADASQLEQVIMNLAVNARDACQPGGVVVLQTEVVARAGGDACDVVMRVEDTGHGMDEDTLSHLFEPFFTTKALGEGTGLGLSMVYGIVTQSGGSIGARSKLGEGSVFEMQLPAAAGSEPSSSGVV